MTATAASGCSSGCNLYLNIDTETCVRSTLHAGDRHGNIATNPELSRAAASVITGIFKNRWRTLMAVDDLIGEVVRCLDELGVLEETFIFFSSGGEIVAR